MLRFLRLGAGYSPHPSPLALGECFSSLVLETISEKVSSACKMRQEWLVVEPPLRDVNAAACKSAFINARGREVCIPIVDVTDLKHGRWKPGTRMLDHVLIWQHGRPRRASVGSISGT